VVSCFVVIPFVTVMMTSAGPNRIHLITIQSLFSKIVYFVQFAVTDRSIRRNLKNSKKKGVKGEGEVNCTFPSQTTSSTVMAAQEL
jgi:hypothetical protein